jgi:proteasome alpha subunit
MFMEIQPPMKQMGYDRAIVVFSPEGKMYQIEYAGKAVERATTVVGVVFTNGVVLAAVKALQKLMVPESIEKISKIDEHIGIATCGILGDSRVLVDYARIRAQVNRITYDEPIEVSALAKDIGDRKQRFTQLGGIRPYGVTLLICGMDNSTPHLFETDPSGAVREWYAHAVGRGAKEAKKVLIDEYRDDTTKDKAIDLALKALKAGEKKLGVKYVEVGVAENGKFHLYSKNELRDVIKKFA